MSALKNYCDKIHEYIRLYGEDYIWHIGWQIEPIPSKQDYRRDHKQETKEHKVFKGDPERLEQIGQKCFDARQECFNEIGKDLILCGKRLSKYIFYSSFSLLTFAAKKIISYDAAT
mgnify:CR=1 FL=1